MLSRFTFCSWSKWCVDATSDRSPTAAVIDRSAPGHYGIVSRSSPVPQQTHVIRLAANIGSRKALFGEEEITAALAPWTALPEVLDIDLTGFAVSDSHPAYHELCASDIRGRVRSFVQERLARSPVRRVCVFGLAPISLLMVLGEALGETQEVRVFNRFHQPAGWTWAMRSPPHSRWAVKTLMATPNAMDIRLLLSVSGQVDLKETEQILPPTGYVAAYEIGVEQPRPDVIRTERQLQEFAGHYRELLAKIRTTHGPRCRIHVFPAVPVAIAVQCGLGLLPKADPALRIYDYQRDAGGFVHAFDLLAELPAPASAPTEKLPLSALSELFLEIFNEGDLREFLMSNGHTHVVDGVSWKNAPSTIANEVAEQLQRHGVLGPAFFAALRKKRGAQVERIGRVAERFGVR